MVDGAMAQMAARHVALALNVDDALARDDHLRDALGYLEDAGVDVQVVLEVIKAEA